MARLPALVETLAAHDFRDRGTVELVARLVREAGLIQTTKRGPGAAHMTALDAAYLILGLNAAISPKESARAAERYSQLEQAPLYAASLGFPPALEEVQSAATFGRALEVVIERAGELGHSHQDAPAIARRFVDDPGRQDPFLDTPRMVGVGISVSFLMPRPAGRITIYWPSADHDRDLQFYQIDYPYLAGYFAEGWANTHRRVMTTIDFDTFRAVNATLFPRTG